MTREFLKAARAQAALSALRLALDIHRRHPAKEAERRIVEAMRRYKLKVDEVAAARQARREDADEAEYAVQAAITDELENT